MNDNRLSLLCAAALAFGCSAGVSGKTGTGGSNGTGTGGSGGSNASGGHGGSSSTGGSNATGGSSSTGGVSGTDASLDGACAASNVSAQPVPLDLYFLMDSSKSMNEKTGSNGTGNSKWLAVSSALNTFFTDAGSGGLGVALKYFPDEQGGAKASCDTATATTDCGSFGPCDYRETCVPSASSTTQVSPLCLSNADCGTQTCSRIQDCGANTGGGENYCAAGPTAAANACKVPGTSTACSTFPGYCHLRDICTSSDYATPNVALGTLPGAAAALTTSLMAHNPDGFTPTGPALTGAVAWAKQQQTNNPDHKVAIVLVTDGLPGGFIPGFPPPECAPSDIPTISGILSNANTGATPIPTFVVGIFNPGIEATTAQTNLDMLATAGGTSKAVVIDVTQNTVTQQLHDAIAQAQTKAIACSYQIPPSTGGTGLDFNQVNVKFDGSSGPTTIGHTSASTACDKGGWYYDVDPSLGTPTKIIACPSTCTQFNADVSGHVKIVLGCATISVT